MSDPTILFCCQECGFSVDVESITGREDCEANICAPCLRKMPRAPRRTYSARRRAATFNGTEAMETPKRRLRFE